MSSHSLLRPLLNSLEHARLNIYKSAFACLMLKAHSHCRVNEWKSCRQNTSSSWWVPGHFTVTHRLPTGSTSFSGHERRRPPGRGSLLGWGGSAERRGPADAAVSLWKEAICAFRVGSGPKGLNRGGLDCHPRALHTKTTSYMMSCEHGVRQDARMKARSIEVSGFSFLIGSFLNPSPKLSNHRFSQYIQ